MFNEFLRLNDIDESIWATDEAVSFENKNGKKFVYPLADLFRCLRLIWGSGNRFQSLLGNDWHYEEDKYRKALGEIFGKEESNAPVSNLGSQTPMTVRCLELYAYYRLGLKPSSSLAEPKILSHDSLSPIFEKLSLVEAFSEWLRTEESLSPKSVQSYIGALKGVLSRSAGLPLLEVSSAAKLEELREKTLGMSYIVALDAKGKGMYRAAFNRYAKFLGCRPEAVTTESIPAASLALFLTSFRTALSDVGFVRFGGTVQMLDCSFIASLAAKPFLVLTGLSGSGKTKLAQAFVRWLTPDSSLFGDSGSVDSNPQYALIPVGADWTGNENILGYPDGLDSSRYVSKPALEVILHAHNHPELPHFLILDEMNLSHVERYFADMLSAIESGEPIPLYEGADRFKDGTTKIPQRVSVPRNLFIIGTVNVDETTYMFSPKVLDRANVIEFRMDSRELGSFLKNPTKPDFGKLDGAGVAFARTFVNRAKSSVTVPTEIATRFEEEMLLLFKVLQSSGAEFGYRVAQEASRFLYFYQEFGGFSADNTEWFDDALDAVIVQKLLPKLHGSRGKLEGLLWALATFCGGERTGTTEAFLTECLAAAKCEDEAKFSPEAVDQKLRAANPERKARYASSFDKILRMYRKLVRDQFVTFAEA